MAHVFERSPGSWYIRFRLNGKQYLRKVGSSKSQAMAVLKEYQKRRTLSDLTLPELPKQEKPQRILFEDLVLQYCDHVISEKSKKTAKGEIDRIKYLWLPILRGKFIDEIEALTIQKWKEKRIHEKYSTHTIHNDLKVLKTMYSKARQWKLFVGDDPVGKLPRVTKRDPYYPFAADIERYLSCCPDYYYPSAAIMVFTGLRLGELLSLKWSDVDLIRKVIRVRPDASLKNDKGRDIPINDQLLPIIQSIPKTHELVFPGVDSQIIWDEIF